MMSASHSPAETKAALHEVVTEMYDKIVKGEPPTMTLPVRTKNNIGFDKTLGVYKYGKKRSVRDATSLGSAKQLLRALHVVEFIEEMIDAGKSSTLREMYYIQRVGVWVNSLLRTNQTTSLKTWRSSPNAFAKTSNCGRRKTALV